MEDEPVENYQELGSEALRKALACMVMDLQREEDKHNALRKELAEAHEAERVANEFADAARVGEQRALTELRQMIEVQVSLTDQLDELARKLDSEETHNRQLRCSIAAADTDRENEKALHESCVRRLDEELAAAMSQQQKFLDCLTDKDKQLAASTKTSSSQTAVVIQQEQLIEALREQLSSGKEELQQATQLTAGTDCTRTASRACSPVNFRELSIIDCHAVIMDAVTDGQALCISDTRSVLEQLCRQLGAARLENLHTNRCKTDVWERMVHVEAENVALRLKVQHLQKAASLTHMLASRNGVEPSCESHVTTRSELAAAGQGSMNLQGDLDQDDRIVSSAHVVHSQGNMFHWTGIDVCVVAKQRDDALHEAMIAAAEAQHAKHELFLINARLQGARAVEESAAQAISQVSGLSVRCADLMFVLVDAASHVQKLSTELSCMLKQVGEHAEWPKNTGLVMSGQDVVKSLKRLSCALKADVKRIEDVPVSLTSQERLNDGIGSQERQRLFHQMEQYALQLQHASVAACRARAASCSVLERCLGRLETQSRWLHVVFALWRGMAERQALAACAHRAQELEDWVAQARESNCTRLNSLLQCQLSNKRCTMMQCLLLFWRHVCRAKKAARSRWVLLRYAAVASDTRPHQRKTVACRRALLQRQKRLLVNSTCSHAVSLRLMWLCFRSWYMAVVVSTAQGIAISDMVAVSLAEKRLRLNVLLSRAWIMWRRAVLPIRILGVRPAYVCQSESVSGGTQDPGAGLGCSLSIPAPQPSENTQDEWAVDVPGANEAKGPEGTTPTVASSQRHDMTCASEGCQTEQPKLARSSRPSHVVVREDVNFRPDDDCCTRCSPCQAHVQSPGRVFITAERPWSKGHQTENAQLDFSSSSPCEDSSQNATMTSQGAAGFDAVTSLPADSPQKSAGNASTPALSTGTTPTSPTPQTCPGRPDEGVKLCQYGKAPSSRATTPHKPTARRNSIQTKGAPIPWRPSGNTTRHKSDHSVCLPRQVRVKRNARSACRTHVFPTSKDHPMASVLVDQAQMSELSRCNASSGYSKSARGVAAISVCHVHKEVRARSLPPERGPAASCHMPLQGAATHRHIPRHRSQSAPCAWPQTAQPSLHQDLDRVNSGASTIIRSCKAGIATMIKSASQKSKLAGPSAEMRAIPGSRAARRKGWDRADFLAVRRLGFKLEDALHPRLGLNCSAESHDGEQKSGSVRACSRHTTRAKSSRHGHECGGAQAADGTRKSTKRAAAKIQWADGTAVYAEKDLQVPGRLQPDQSVRRAQPLNMSKRAARVRHILVEKSSVKPLLLQAQHACQQSRKATLQEFSGYGNIPAQQDQDSAMHAGAKIGGVPQGRPKGRHPGPECSDRVCSKLNSMNRAEVQKLEDTQSSKMPHAAVSYQMQSTQNSGRPCSRRGSGIHGVMRNVGADSVPSVMDHIPQQDLVEAEAQAASEQSAESGVTIVPSCEASSSDPPSQPGLISSTVAAVNVVCAETMAVSDMRQQIAQGSLPGLSELRELPVHGLVPFVPFQTGDVVCLRNNAPHRAASTTIASQLKEDIPYKVRLNAAVRNKPLNPTGDAEIRLRSLEQTHM